MNINESLKNTRRQLGYSLRYVARHADVAKSTIANIEAGKIDCGYKKIERLKAYYDKELLAKEITHEND